MMVRTALYEAANILMSRVMRFSALKLRGMEVATRRGLKRAKVALTRKIGVILHRMWDAPTTDGTKKPAATTTETHRKRRARYSAPNSALARRARHWRS
jgi:hypothetical protein